jgi:hypothetical protein
MSMEKLTTTFEKIITEYTKAYDNDDPTAGGWAIFELIKAVKERDAFIIGENEKDAAVYVDYTANSGHFRNELREEQNQRAEESR